METIFALASAQGRAGVSVIRLSGPDAKEVVSKFVSTLPEDRVAGLRTLSDDAGDPLDRALILRFDAPHSFTGEDIVELHLHGSIAVVQAVLRVLGDSDLARLAQPGEFTRRALENGQMDLAQVEGLADLIESETEAQRKQALRVVSGHLGQLVERWRLSLIRAAALIEATIDFVDEDVPVDVSPEVCELLTVVKSDLIKEIVGSKVAERIRVGFEVAIVGAPNAGKSTLLNAMAGRDAAITSEIAGTTRDVIEVRMDLNGLPVTILDTAGLRDGKDAVEVIGIERALKRAGGADLRIFLAGKNDDLPLTQQSDDIRITPKADISGVGVSGKTGQGVSELLARVQNILENRSSQAGLATHERHRIAMQSTLAALDIVLPLVDQGPSTMI